MKLITMVSGMIFLAGLSVLADTNSVPAQVPNATAPQTETTNNPAQPSNILLTNNTVAQPAESSVARQHRRDKALAKEKAQIDHNAQVNAIFHPGNDLSGDTVIHDTIITIYPTGR